MTSSSTSRWGRIGAIVGALAVLVALDERASAQEPAPEPPVAENQKAVDARKAFDSHDYRAAALLFQAAFDETRQAKWLYNAGLAWAAADRSDAGAGCIAASMDLPDLPDAARSSAAVRLTEAAAQYGRIRVTAPAGSIVRLTDGCKVPAPAILFAPPGSRVSVAGRTQDGHELEAKTIDAPAVGATAPTVELKERGAHKSSRYLNTQRVAGFTFIGVSPLFLALGIGLGKRGLDVRDEFDAGGHTSADLHDEAIDLRTAANVMFTVAAVTGAAGVLLVTLPVGANKPQAGAGSISIAAAPSSVQLAITLP